MTYMFMCGIVPGNTLCLYREHVPSEKERVVKKKEHVVQKQHIIIKIVEECT